MTDIDTGTQQGFKRIARQDATTYNDEADEEAHTGAHSSSGSTAPPAQPVAAGSHPSAVGRVSRDPPIRAAVGRASGDPPTRKRQAEVTTEDLDDGMKGEAGLIDIMFMHVGPAYIANPTVASVKSTLHPE